MKKYILIVLFPLCICSCFSGERDLTRIWGTDIELFEDKLISRNNEFISSFDYDRLKKRGKLNEIFNLNPGGAFYYSFILEELSKPAEQLLFLELEMREGRWRQEAVYKINEKLSEQEQWDRLSQILQFYYNEIESDPDVYIYMIEALFHSEKYGKIIEYSQNDFSGYYTVLSLIETEHHLWKTSLIEFIFNRATAEQIEHLYGKLQTKNLFFELDESIRLHILAFSSYVNGDFAEAGEYFKEVLIDFRLINQYPAFFYKLQDPLIKSGQAERWASTFQSEKSSFASTFVAGRLFLYLNDFANGDRSFRQAIELAETDFEKDRARWYLMNLYKNNLYFFAGLIEEFAPFWKDPAYFDDILDDYLSLLVSKGEWIVFNRIYPLIESYGDDETRAAYSWVKYLAGKSNLVIIENEKELLSIVVNSRHLGFYNMAGTLVSGDKISFESENLRESEFSETDVFIEGFLDFRLEEQALKNIRGIESLLNSDILRTLARYSSESGDNLRSIQLINYVSSKKGYVYSLEDLKLMYPKKYDQKIRFYSELYGFPGELFTGLIRTESAFTHDIISYAGAVGLSQLMPETAEEQARKLKLYNPDLSDPETNIHIGSSYLKWVIDRDWTDNLSEALIAYNAGGGNLRRWKRLYPTYRAELFAEAIPYKETRNYVKKVLTSSIIYGSVYEGLDPVDILRKIYPDFNSIKSINHIKE